MSDVRKAPRPPFERAPLCNGRRVCPMCGDVVPFKRGWWHRECAEIYRYIAFPNDARRSLVALHGRICWGCGKREEPNWDGKMVPVRLEYEHVRPLWSLTDDERKEFKWWLPFNLQLLCRDCHKSKTAREAADRYALQNPDGALAQRRRVAAMSPELWPVEAAS